MNEIPSLSQVRAVVVVAVVGLMGCADSGVQRQIGLPDTVEICGDILHHPKMAGQRAEQTRRMIEDGFHTEDLTNVNRMGFCVSNGVDEQVSCVLKEVEPDPSSVASGRYSGADTQVVDAGWDCSFTSTQ